MPTDAATTYIRWMIRSDLQAVLDIEEEAFEHPWSRDDFKRAMRQRNCVGMVVECDGAVGGYMVYALEKSRISLLNLAVAPKHWRQGVGTAMIDKLKGKLTTQRRNRITVQVWEKNLRGQLFFKACGFQAIDVLRSWCDNGDDAYRMVYRIMGGE